MYHLNPQTLAYFKAALPLKARHISTTVRDTVIGMKDYHDAIGCTKQMDGLLSGESKMVYPEMEAVRFYFLNHCFAMLSNMYSDHEILPEPALELADEYLVSLSTIGRRLFTYLLKIITREARHLKSAGTINPRLRKEYGDEFVGFRNNIPHGSEAAVQYLMDQSPEKVFLDVYCAGLADLFHHGNFSGGYGGSAWGNIADTIARFTAGETSLEAFVDTAFTLAHNNGPIFNKGMHYYGYSHHIKMLLDVQSSGQMPELIADVMRGDYTISHVSNHELSASYKKALAVFPALEEGFVDWWDVEKLGYMKNSYSDMKEKQIINHGEPEHLAETKAMEAAEEAKKFHIMPGVTALKIERAA